ncbi:hypothetical protein GCM10010329_07820 [Streptomyces spiroverticillatus]|uniref:Lipoprotein n=1 Tax=Streptomyces finlayi TaxID=67296 RepID=A0A918WT39_9ACTN|nr:hypothetical protein [Streptomyces finlayi]GGZ89820.1 hypothetical protein GCM10010329_07820 [Streptomyces spiroverticillatus]GHC80632.1 hypothetical protein GCM10010334_07810 [Streptomyces finlayi]
MKRNRKPGATILAGAMVVALTGCGEAQDTAGWVPAKERAEAQVRQDRAPVERRFPAFGEFVRARWVGVSLNNPRLPGPTDVEMAGVVDLSARDAERLRTRYEWREAAGSGTALPGAVTPLLPEGAHWRTSDAFDREVTRDGSYSATFRVDFEKRVLTFDAVNPAAPPATAPAQGRARPPFG